MPLSKRRRNQFWYGYVLGMVVFYELAMLVLGFTVAGFLVAFFGIALMTIGFVILMRRLTRPTSQGDA
jgi:hypothetical protein